MKKDKSLIPYGQYCYSSNKLCPYWSIKNNLPEQMNGYCSYLEKSDRDLHNEYIENIDNKNIPFSLSLLWDQCKECGINEEFDED